MSERPESNRTRWFLIAAAGLGIIGLLLVTLGPDLANRNRSSDHRVVATATDTGGGSSMGTGAGSSSTSTGAGSSSSATSARVMALWQPLVESAVDRLTDTALTASLRADNPRALALAGEATGDVAFIGQAREVVAAVNGAVTDAWPEAVAAEQDRIAASRVAVLERVAAAQAADRPAGDPGLFGIIAPVDPAEAGDGDGVGVDAASPEGAELAWLDGERDRIGASTPPQFEVRRADVRGDIDANTPLAGWLWLAGVALLLAALIALCLAIPERWARWSLLAITGVVIVGWIAAAAWSASSARQAADDAADVAARLRVAAADDLDVAALATDAKTLRDLADDAEGHLNRSWLTALHGLPVAGAQLRATTDLINVANPTIRRGADLASSGAELLEGLQNDSIAQSEVPRRLLPRVANLRSDVADLIDYSPGALPGSAAAEWENVQSDLDDAQGALCRIERALTLLGDLSAGEEWLVVAGTTLFVQATTLSADDDGRLSAGEIRTGADVPDFWAWIDDGAIAVEDLRFRLEFLERASDTERADAEPRARLWTTIPSAPVDGVMYLDPVTLAHLVDTTGAISLGDTTYDGGALISQLISGARDESTALTGAVIQRLIDIDWRDLGSVRDLAEIFDARCG